MRSSTLIVGVLGALILIYVIKTNFENIFLSVLFILLYLIILIFSIKTIYKYLKEKDKNGI